MKWMTRKIGLKGQQWTTSTSTNLWFSTLEFSCTDITEQASCTKNIYNLLVTKCLTFKWQFSRRHSKYILTSECCMSNNYTPVFDLLKVKNKWKYTVMIFVTRDHRHKVQQLVLITYYDAKPLNHFKKLRWH